MDKIYNISEIFGSTNVKVQSKLSNNICVGCYFWRDVPPYCFKPAYIDSCEEDGQNSIFIKLH